MTEPTDHKAEARNHLISGVRRANSGDHGGAAFEAAVAQVYATLALAEQQRIANLISLMQVGFKGDEIADVLAQEGAHALVEYVRTPATPVSGPGENPVLRGEIKKALGLS